MAIATSVAILYYGPKVITGIKEVVSQVDIPTTTIGHYDQMSQASDSGKNERHGDGGRELTKSEKQIEALESQLNGATRKERQKIEQKIRNIRQSAQKAKKGEEHSKANKR